MNDNIQNTEVLTKLKYNVKRKTTLFVYELKPGSIFC